MSVETEETINNKLILQSTPDVEMSTLKILNVHEMF